MRIVEIYTKNDNVTRVHFAGTKEVIRFSDYNVGNGAMAVVMPIIRARAARIGWKEYGIIKQIDDKLWFDDQGEVCSSKRKAILSSRGCL